MSHSLRKNTNLIVLALLLAFMGILCAYQLDARPIHNDESANHFFTKQIQNEYFYRYSHENYHGPSYFYLLTASVIAFGEGEAALRLPGIVFFIFIPLSFLLLSKDKNKNLFITILFTALLSCSTSGIFYARYAIHEMLFALLGFTTGLSVLNWTIEKKAKYIFISSFIISLLIATKETYIISLFCVFVSVLLITNPKKIYQGIISQRKEFIFGLIILIFLTTSLFTGGFQWTDGIFEFGKGVQQWISRNKSDSGHHKAFIYYLKSLYLAEKIFIFGYLSSFGIVIYLILKKQIKDIKLSIFFFLFSLISFIVYSLISYKTPWLLLNFTIPGYLFIAIQFSQLYSKNRYIFFLLFPLLCILGIGQTIKYNYKFSPNSKLAQVVGKSDPYSETNPFSYVHTADGMIALSNDIKSYLQDHPDSQILAGSTHYWPLPYYLRDYPGKISAIKTDDPSLYTSNHDILIIDDTIRWKRFGWIKKSYQIMDISRVNVYFRDYEALTRLITKQTH